MSLVITKLNETYMQIDAEPSVIQELSELLTFDVPHAKFTPAFRRKQWDGKIRLFNRRFSSVYTGLIHYIEQYAKSAGHEIKKDFKTSTFTEHEYNEFMNDLMIFGGDKELLTLRDYQIDAIKKGITSNRAIFLSPTGSGKSALLFALMKFYFDYTDKNILMIVPSTSLVEQLYSDFIEYSNGTFDVETNVCRIYSGMKRFKSRITLSTWQSLYDEPEEFFENYETVLADECHLYKSKETSKLFEKCVNTKYRFGFTGTLSGENIHQLQLEGLFGKAIKLTSTSEMMQKKQLSSFKIKTLVLKYSKETCKERRADNWEDEVQFLIGHEKRNRFIAKLASTLKGNTLVLFSRVEKHGLLIYELIKELVGDRVHFIHGGTEVEIREHIRKSVTADSNVIIVASSQIFATGTTLQSIGRALRKSKKKRCAYLFDMVDDMRSGKRENYAYRHFKERMELYITEDFEYVIDTIQLEK
jgi:superfamily II DNA or RNA helicase